MKLTLNILAFYVLLSCQKTEKTSCNYVTDYYPYTTNAEMHFYMGNYKKAFVNYQKAFVNCEAIDLGTKRDIGIFARVCAELGKEDLALEYIEKRIAIGGTIEEFQRDRIFIQLLNTERGQKIVSDYDQNRAKFMANIDLDLRQELQNMIRLDQKFNSTKFQDSMFKVNDKKLVDIFEKYGYPNDQIIGPYNIDQLSTDPSILLLHTDDSIRINYFIPKIKRFVENGNCPPYLLGILLDNLELFNERPQTHGTYLNGNGGYANLIPDTSKVNANRKSIGLPTMETTRRLDSIKFLYFK